MNKLADIISRFKSIKEALSKGLDCAPNEADMEKKHIGFDKLQHKIEAEGHGKDSAGAIAASIGRKKYGAKGFADMAHKSEEVIKFGENGQWNIEKADVMPMTTEKESEKAKVTGKPYDGTE